MIFTFGIVLYLCVLILFERIKENNNNNVCKIEFMLIIYGT
jgi:hypothetical protein